MAVSDQLHQMEGQISRLENEIQRRDDIINSLKTSKIQREKRLSQRLSKDTIFKDMLSDVDSAVSSAPNSLSPQPSPDLWYRHQDASQVEVDEGLLEAAKKQIQELEKALNLSTAGQKQAQSKVSQLEEQLQDLREHADLLEFRCLELEDSVEKRHSMEELTDSDSGCTSPENRLKNSVSPQLRRSDSGYKSPTRSVSPTVKNSRRISVPAPFPEQDTMLSCTENYKAIVHNLHLQSLESIFENGYCNDEVKDRLEGIILKTNSKNDRLCLEQIMQLLWNLQALGNSLKEDDFSVVKNKKSVENDLNKCDFEQQIKSGKIVATVSPYSQKALSKSNNDLNKSCDEVDLAKFTVKEESRKLLFGLQESGIFEEGDWESKSTQTECYDCVCPESESDLATEVLRLNQIREQLEKSGAIKNKNESYHENSKPLDSKQRRKEKKKIELYENRIFVLENKISIYESSDDVREKRLAQRLQREIDLQSKVKNLEFDLAKLKKQHIFLEQEKCEIEEIENETRLQCQELEAEFDILTAKLRDLDDQRSCARNESECYRQLVEEYEYKIMTMQNNERDMESRAEAIEKIMPALLTYNTYCALKSLIEQPQCSCSNKSNSGKLKLMLQYPDNNAENSNSKQNSRPAISNCECSNQLFPSNASTQYEDPEELRRYKEDEENKLRMRIQELEKRELAYLETLTKGDEMWADMETSYKQKLKELEENEAHLVNSLKKWKSKVEEKEKKILEMEENEEQLRMERKHFLTDLREVKKFKEDLERQNNRLQGEVSDSRLALEEKHKEYQNNLNMMKQKADYSRSELEAQKRLYSDSEKEFSTESSKMKKDLRRTIEELETYKESVKELTEVVKTLRENLCVLEGIMREQKNDFNTKAKFMLHEIKGKSDEVESLRGSLARFENLPSAKDEFDNLSTKITDYERKDNQRSVSNGQQVDHRSTTSGYQADCRNNSNGRQIDSRNSANGQQIDNRSAASRQQADNRIAGSYNDQATTLITIKAIKHPASLSRNIECRCDTEDPSTSRVYGRINDDNRVKFKKGDNCNILYGGITNRSTYGESQNDSAINLFNMDSVGSVPSGYRARQSPENFNMMSDIARKCACQSAGTPSRNCEAKNGNERRSCSCKRSNQTSAPPAPCYCCGCKQLADKSFKHENLPLLVLTKTEPEEQLPSKCKCKAALKKPHDKKMGNISTKSKDKRENACKTTEKSTSYHSDVDEQKPNVPCHKPDVPYRKPKVPSKPKCPKKKVFVNSGPPMNLKPLPNDDLENTVSKMLCQSLESCLDAKNYVVCQQVNKLEEINKSLIMQQTTVKEFPKSCGPEVAMNSTATPVHDSSLTNELEVLSSSKVTPVQSPIPTPRKHLMNKRNRSMTVCEVSNECESLPPIMCQSDSGVSYSTITAKELIASFNSIGKEAKVEKTTNNCKNSVQTKSIGSFVFDRVNKLTNGLSNVRIMPLKRSVSMVADSKTPAKFYDDF